MTEGTERLPSAGPPDLEPRSKSSTGNARPLLPTPVKQRAAFEDDAAERDEETPSSPLVTIRSNDVVSDSKAAHDLRCMVRPDTPAEYSRGASSEHPSSSHTPFGHASGHALPIRPSPNSVLGDGVEHRHHSSTMRPNHARASGHAAQGANTVPEVPAALHTHPKVYQLWLAAVLGGVIALGLAAIHTHPASTLRAARPSAGNHRSPGAFGALLEAREIHPDARRPKERSSQSTPPASAMAGAAFAGPPRQR
ncbi:MAG: hypothetical protein QM784_39375 [Polyangiaceae bacterium]